MKDSTAIILPNVVGHMAVKWKVAHSIPNPAFYSFTALGSGRNFGMSYTQGRSHKNWEIRRRMKFRGRITFEGRNQPGEVHKTGTPGGGTNPGSVTRMENHCHGHTGELR
jgi:hypothetical protein